MMMNSFLTIFILSILTFSSIHAIAIDDFHCKIPTCRDFYYSLVKHPRRQEYVDICYETVYALQAIPSKKGKCINEKTGKIHAPCFRTLAITIKRCIERLTELSDYQAKFLCGYTLMTYCAVHLGLEKIPLNFDLQT